MRKIKKQSAFSLMELLITIGILLLTVLGITLMAQLGFRYYNFAINQAEIVSNIQKSINTSSKEIREIRQADSGAFAIEEANDNQFIFYSDIDETSEVERVRYSRSGNCLRRGITEPSGTPPRYLIDSEEITDISCNVTNNIDEPIFIYYSNYPSEISLLPTPADPHLVKVINIYLRISSTGKNPIPVSKVISEYISPRNINQEQEN